jgi:Calcineurin-like phosphoesterase
VSIRESVASAYEKGFKMIRTIFTLTLITILVAACSPAATTPTHQPKPTQAVGQLTTAASTSIPTEQAPSEPTKKPKGQKTPGGLSSTSKSNGQAPLSIPTVSNPDFAALEISGQPTNTSLTINIVPATDMQITITYGTDSAAPQTVSVAGKANQPTEISLTALAPDTAYFYSVNGGEKHTFHTARAPGSTFTFDIQGDSHPERTKNQFDPNLYVRTLTGAANDEPDFYLTIGDDFSVDTLKTVNAQTVTERYIAQRQWLGLVDAPVFLVNGNHEQASLANLDGTVENVAVWAQTARNAYYPQPAPDAFYSGNPEPVEHIGLLRNYYAWEWGDALFVIIDPYWHSPQAVDNQFGADRDEKKNRNLWNATLGETQYRWLRQTLETSTAKYKFVFAHHVNGTGRGGIELANSFEWGDSANLVTHRPGWDKTIHQIMVDGGVTIFFQGHDHIFVRQELDGVIYQSLPEPANPFYSWENADAYQTGDKFPNSGRLRVTVSPEGVKLDYIRSYLDKPDEVAFSYMVP